MEKKPLIGVSILAVVLLVLGSLSNVVGYQTQNIENQSSTSRGNWLYVGGSGPGNYTTIQDAIDASSVGDTIFVYDDSAPYYEHYLIIDKTIHLIGENKTTTIIDSSKGLPIFVIQSDNVIITGFYLKNTSSSSDGINLDSASYCSLYDNIISNVGNAGIMLWGHCNYNNIYNNRINNGGCGICLYWYCQHNSIYYNKINGTDYGLSIGGDNSNYNYIGNNTCYNNYYGVDLYQSAYYNSVADNTFIGGSSRNWFGIIMDSGTNLIVRNTVIGYNYGVYLQDYAHDNIFSKNSFIQCLTDARDQRTNTWDLGYSGGGNYYSSYNGPDADKDGIGDTPFQIPGGSNIDHYPLINPYGSIRNLNTNKIYRTIQYAINDTITQNGDVINLQKNIFHEQIEITKGIQIHGENKNGVIIDSSNNGIPIVISTDNVQINQLQIQNSGNQSNDCGISIQSNGTLIHNTTIFNCRTGILINQGEDNHIYHNNFISNNISAWTNTTNLWDDGYPGGGNYWDDYNGTDTNGDGIGDTSYDIPGGACSDHYPYMNENGWMNHPPSPPKINGPIIGAVNKSYDFSFVSTDQDNDPVSYFILWGDNTSTGWTSFYSSGEQKVFNHTWHQIGNYSIIGNAKDTFQVQSSEATPFAITIVENNPPIKPSITGLKQGKVGTIYNYTIQTTDPDGNDIYYWVDWGDDSNTGWLGPASSGESITINHSWSEKGTYIIMAKAKDSLQVESEWGQFNIRMPLNIQTYPIHKLIIFLIDKFLNSRFVNIVNGLKIILYHNI